MDDWRFRKSTFLSWGVQSITELCKNNLIENSMLKIFTQLRSNYRSTIFAFINTRRAFFVCRTIINFSCIDWKYIIIASNLLSRVVGNPEMLLFRGLRWSERNRQQYKITKNLMKWIYNVGGFSFRFHWHRVNIIGYEMLELMSFV